MLNLVFFIRVRFLCATWVFEKTQLDGFKAFMGFKLLEWALHCTSNIILCPQQYRISKNLQTHRFYFQHRETISDHQRDGNFWLTYSWTCRGEVAKLWATCQWGHYSTVLRWRQAWAIKHGVGILLSREAAKSMISWETVSDRIMTVGLRTRATIVQVYAPTNAAIDSDKNVFYHQQDAVTDSIPS